MPNPLDLMAYIGIANTHTARLYFRLTLSAPGSYSNYDRQLGYVESMNSKFFVYNLNRSLPTLSNGEFNENVTLEVHAYTDAGYSNELVFDTLVLPFHYIDHAHSSWTVVDHTNFDNGFWGNYNDSINGYLETTSGCFDFYISNEQFLSAPYSIKMSSYNGYRYHCFDLRSFTRAYFIIHHRTGAGTDSQHSDLGLRLNWLMAISYGTPMPKAATWYRSAFKVPLVYNMEVAFAGYVQTQYDIFVDEIWVIAK